MRVTQTGKHSWQQRIQQSKAKQKNQYEMTGTSVEQDCKMSNQKG